MEKDLDFNKLLEMFIGGLENSSQENSQENLTDNLKTDIGTILKSAGINNINKDNINIKNKKKESYTKKRVEFLDDLKKLKSEKKLKLSLLNKANLEFIFKENLVEEVSQIFCLNKEDLFYLANLLGIKVSHVDVIKLNNKDDFDIFFRNFYYNLKNIKEDISLKEKLTSFLYENLSQKYGIKQYSKIEANDDFTLLYCYE